MSGPAATRIAEEAGAAALIEAELLAGLRATLPQSLNTRFTLAARDDGGRLVGGLSAGTSYGWLLVKTLWVAEPARRHGLGAALLREAEARGRALGCHAAWLDSSNPAAVGFYARHGYAPFGVLANGPGEPPETHRRVFMQKRI